ncbi:MAG: TatD family hydrolase [Clostridia bacterium]|nr:TatD family hydrolase [Clostridia bacterium]
MRSKSFFDVHNHIENYGEYKDIPALFKSNINKDTGVLMMAMDTPTYLEAAKIEEKVHGAVAAFGIHPWRAHLYHDKTDEFEAHVRRAKIVGEIGMCAKWAPKESSPFQRELFRFQLELAKKYGRPVSVHTVGTEKECLEILRAADLKNVCIHWFHGTVEQAKKYLDLGCYFSLGPDVGFSPEADELARFLPRERILLETDGAECFSWARECKKSPWQFEPAAIKDVYYQAARVRNEDFDTLALAVWENFFDFTLI